MSREKHRVSPTSYLLQFDVHSVLVHLGACAVDRCLRVQSFCRSFHGDRKWNRITCLFPVAEVQEDVTVIQVSKTEICCVTFIKSERAAEPHLGLKLDLWTLLTLESAGLNGLGDLLPEQSKKICTCCSCCSVTVKTWVCCLWDYLPVFVWRKESDWTGAASCQS